MGKLASFFLNPPTDKEDPANAVTREQVDEYIARDLAPLPRWRRTLGSFWDTFSKDPETRELTNRLDRFLLVYSMYVWFVKFLDQSNVTNAYVSGMQEDLHMVGQDRNFMTLMFNMGYMVGSTLWVVVMTKVRPSVVLTLCETVWTICTFGIVGITNVQQLYGLRFVTGLASASAYPGFMWIIGGWYGPDQLAKRMILFAFSSTIGIMTSGWIQAGVYDSLRGKGGIPGWKWPFVVDGLIGLPMCVMGFFIIPDFPSNTRAFWLKPKHRALALVRQKAFGRAAPRPFTILRFLSYFKTWAFWCFGTMIVLFTVANSSSTFFNLWLQSLHKYTVAQINEIPTGGPALQLITGIAYATISDATGWRWQLVIFAALVGLVANIILSVWYLPMGVIMFAMFLLSAADGGTGVTAAWIHETLQTDNEQRGMMLGMFNTVAFSLQAWTPLVLFPTPMAPHYAIGYQVQCGWYGFIIVVTLLWVVILRRQVRSGKKQVNELGLLVDPVDPVDNKSHANTAAPAESSEGEEGVTTITEEPKKALE